MVKMKDTVTKRVTGLMEIEPRLIAGFFTICRVVDFLLENSFVAKVDCL